MAVLIHSVLVVSLLLGSFVADASGIPPAYRHIAAEYRVPAEVLYAVALTESGQSALSGGHWRPWPWTLNVNGRGQYFASRYLAWQTLQHSLRQGTTSVDIGLMQVSWRYHRAALVSSWHALDPHHNLRVAAAILQSCYDKHRDWWASAGCYHAPNNSARAQAYTQRVQRHWRNLNARTAEGDVT
jgi:hypothetical protein